MDERYHYRNLILWQRAQQLAYEIIQVTKRLPKTWASAVIVKQIIASASSIAANIAEGHGRFSIRAYRYHLSIARGSAAETDSWLDLLRRDGLLSVAEEQHLHKRCSQILGMLTTKINALGVDEQQPDRSLREDAAEYNAAEAPGTPLPYDPKDSSP